MSNAELLENKEKQWIGTKTCREKIVNIWMCLCNFSVFPSVFICKGNIHSHF